MNRTGLRSGTGVVVRRELDARLRGKGFWIGLLATSAAIVALVVVPTFFQDSTEYDVALAGPASESLVEPMRQLADQADVDLQLSSVESAGRARATVADGEADAAVVDGTTLVTDGEPDRTLTGLLEGAHQQVGLLDNLAAAGLDASAARAASSVAPLRVVQLDPDASDDRARQGLALVLMVSLLMLLMTSATGVAIGVVEEKGNRIVEILLIAVRPRELLAGKLLAFGTLGAVQLATFALSGLLAAKAVGLTEDLPAGAPTIVLAAAAGYVLGFAFFASLAAALGSLVSRQEEVNGALGPLSTLMICSYLGAFLALQEPGSTMARVLSVVPPFSAMAMPVRAATSDVGAAELGLAVVLMVAAVVAIVLLGARVYERSVLRVGSRLRLGEVLRSS